MKTAPAADGTHRSPTAGTADDRRERGQGSIGSVIVLIALLLVATATAGALFEVTGAFQNDAAATGAESADKVLSRVAVIHVTGRVDATATPHTVDRVTVVLKRADGSGVIDVNRLVVTTTLGDGAKAVAGTSPAITLDPLVDGDGSLRDGLLAGDDDRLALRLDVRALTGAELRPSDSGTLRLVSPDGGTTSVRLTVPSSFGGRRTVSL